MALYETNYPIAASDDVKKQAMETILVNAYLSSEEDPDLRGRVEVAYKELMGVELAPDGVEVSPMLPMFLHGSPGHGKTSLIKDAAKSCAKLLGMNFVAEPEDFPGTNDFVFVLYETSGVLSTAELGGIPAIDTISRPEDWKEKGLVPQDAKDEYDVLSKKALRQFTALANSRIGTIIFDDASNANKNVQNALLSLCEEKKFQSSSIGKHTVGFLTGNIGSDGTYVIDPSSALLNRTESVYVEDNVKDWLKRESGKYNDAIGLAGVNAFMKQCPECFAEKATSKKGGPSPFASPRSWSKFLGTLRHWMNRFEQNPNGTRLAELERRAHGTLGRDVADKIGGFYHAYTLGASQVARDVLDNGKFSARSLEKINQHYGSNSSGGVGTGHGASAQDFGYAFASSLAEYGAYKAIEMFMKDGTAGFEKAMDSYAKGIEVIALDAPMAGFSINRLHERMVSLIEGSKGKCKIELADRAKGKIIPIDMRTYMAKQFSAVGVDNKALSDILTHANKKMM